MAAAVMILRVHCGMWTQYHVGILHVCTVKTSRTPTVHGGAAPRKASGMLLKEVNGVVLPYSLVFTLEYRKIVVHKMSYRGAQSMAV